MVSSCRNHYLWLHLYGIESIRRNTAAIFENSFLRAAWFCLNKVNFNTLILGFFSTKQLLAAKKPVFSGFSNRLTISILKPIQGNFGFDSSKKSTPQKNLALTFENLACLQKREKWQNRSKKPAQNHRFVQELSLRSTRHTRPKVRNYNFLLHIFSKITSRHDPFLFRILENLTEAKA